MVNQLKRGGALVGGVRQTNPENPNGVVVNVLIVGKKRIITAMSLLNVNIV
jgi:hypothetical protein